LRKYLAKGLADAGFAVDLAADGQEGLWLAETTPYDVIVLDLMMPRLDGLSVIRSLREQGRDTHVLILTAKDTVKDRVTGLEEGADDYLVKPFAMEELVARVRSLTRRSYATKSPQIEIGDLFIDTAKRVVTRAKEEVDLSPREYALLEYLAMRRGEVVSRTDIEEHIYDSRVEPLSNVVNSAISILRRKIDKPGCPSLIQTRRGMGYVLRTPDS
jgi:DNA-binding response OmpR family regulator